MSKLKKTASKHCRFLKNPRNIRGFLMFKEIMAIYKQNERDNPSLSDDVKYMIIKKYYIYVIA